MSSTADRRVHGTVHSGRDILPALTDGASCFDGYRRNLHRPEFTSVRRCFALHAQPFDFTITGMLGVTCDPTYIHSVCRLAEFHTTNQHEDFAFIPSLSEGVFSLNFVKKEKKQMVIRELTEKLNALSV